MEILVKFNQNKNKQEKGEPMRKLASLTFVAVALLIAPFR